MNPPMVADARDEYAAVGTAPSACPVCHASPLTDLGPVEDFRHGIRTASHIVRCATCGVRVLSPLPEPQEIPGFYPKGQYYTHEQSFGPARVGGIRALVLQQYYGYESPRWWKRLLAFPFRYQFAYYPHAVPLGTVLDIGCGSGAYVSVLTSLEWRTAGIDVDPSAVQRCVENGIEAQVASGDEIPYPDGSFDAVVLKHALEHVRNPRAVLAEVRRVLRPNGEIVILLPNGRSLWARLFGKYWYHLDAPRHIFTFTPVALRRVLEEQGFRVTRCRAVASTDGLVNSLRYRMGRPESHGWSVLKLLSLPLTLLMTLTGGGDLLVASARRSIHAH